MNENVIAQIELDLLVQAIYRRYGHDFRDYSKAHLKRRMQQFASVKSHGRIADLIPKVLHDEAFFETLLREISITVTEMFRDPHVFQSLRRVAIPFLRTFPFIRVWVAGCATGEEAYSLAILLKEEGLYDRSTIFVTDFNDVAVEKAKAGIYPLDSMSAYTRNYQQAGGSGSFSEYYHAGYDSAAMAPWLKENMVFANHNLVTDWVFSEMHLVFCRNVLIYFNQQLQSRVLTLFSEALARGGFLCLGPSEDITFSSARPLFKQMDEKARIFQLKAANAAPGHPAPGT
ncbi:MAG: protein-glutamate O-methyltransferase CheR [Desulfobacteraceae bacterium]|nr:MAG: protein-glutamate O-methyltransferase CheR [Desulfobacteraceae bacterium]